MANINTQTPDAATGKTAMIKGKGNLYGYEVDCFISKSSHMGEILEKMCDVCIDCVKEGSNAAYVFDRFSFCGYDFGVGLAFHNVNGGLFASLHTRSTMKSDLSEVRSKWGEYVTSYIRKRGLEGNKSFAKKVKGHEVSPTEAAILTSAYFDSNLEVK